MGRFENITLDMNVPLKSIKFLLNLATERLAGRLGKKDGSGSFDWKNEKGWELPIKEWEPLVPTHGNFAGPGYSCGKRAEFPREKIREYPVAQIFDSQTGKSRDDFVDVLAKEHDIAYADARGEPDYWEKIHEADRKLVTETQKLLDGTSLLFSDGGKMTPGETAYAESMLDGFKLKLAMMDEPFAAIEKFKNAGYGKKEINDLMNNLTQGIKFLSPQELFHKLDLSGDEIREIEEKYAAYCEENNIQLASASSRYPDEFLDEDQGYYYGPGMGMG
jgi:hypothetical protein